MRTPAMLGIACIVAAALAAAADADGQSVRDRELMILGMQDRWHLGEGMAAGDTYRYAVCDTGMRTAGTCYEATLTVVARVADGNTSYHIIQLAVQDILTSKYSQRQTTGIHEEDRMRIGYGDLPGAERYLLLLDDRTMKFSATDRMRGAEYAASLSRTIGLLGGDIRIGSGNLMAFPAVLDVGQTWNTDGSVIVKSKPGQYGCIDPERGGAYGCDGFVINSTDIYRISYGPAKGSSGACTPEKVIRCMNIQQAPTLEEQAKGCTSVKDVVTKCVRGKHGHDEEMASFTVLDGFPFPVSADIGAAGWRAMQDSNVGTRAWYRLTDMHAGGAAFQTSVPWDADAWIAPSVIPDMPPVTEVKPETAEDLPQEEQFPGPDATVPPEEPESLQQPDTTALPETGYPPEAGPEPSQQPDPDDLEYIDESWYECGGTAGCITGTVTRIVDGDTLDVDDTRIRLALVNTPERGEPGYGEASAFTEEICPVGQSAKVDVDDGQAGGSFGRTVGTVICGPYILNESLAYSEHAVILPRFCGQSEFGSEHWAVENGC